MLQCLIGTEQGTSSTRPCTADTSYKREITPGLRWLKNTLPYMANTVLDKLLKLWNERAFLVASYYWKPARKKPAGNTHQELCIATPQTTFLVAGNG